MQNLKNKTCHNKTCNILKEYSLVILPWDLVLFVGVQDLTESSVEFITLIYHEEIMYQLKKFKVLFVKAISVTFRRIYSDKCLSVTIVHCLFIQSGL